MSFRLTEAQSGRGRRAAPGHDDDSKRIRRAPNPQRAAIQHVRIDHRRANIGVAEQLLHRPNIRPGLEQVRRE